MANAQPTNPIGGDNGWTNYSLFLVTYVSRQGMPAQVTYFASSAVEALSFLANDFTIQTLFGPVTSAAAVPTTDPGVA